MDEPLAKARALSQQHEALTVRLRNELGHLAERMQHALGESEMVIDARPVVLEESADDEAVVGYLYYSQGGLHVAHRYTGDDIYNHPEEPSYSVKEIKDCSFKWLRAVSQQESITSLLEKLVRNLEAERIEAEASLATLANALSAPLQDATGALEAAARRLGYGDIVSMWSSAQGSIITDPREAATRASSLVESVCKHILNTLQVVSPASLTIQALFKEAVKHLALAPAQQTSDDLRRMLSGVSSVVQGLGEFRTHVGTAHGAGPQSSAPTYVQARLVVNLAGALSTFLMETLKPIDSSPSDAA